MRTNTNDARLIGLCLAVLIYGAWGSPTPDHFEWAEGIVFALLCAACPFLRLFHGAQKTSFLKAPLWQASGMLLLLFGISVPLIMGALFGHALWFMLRDIIPFLFMLFPLFFAPLFIGKGDTFRPLLYSILALGALFSVRVLQDKVPFAALPAFWGPADKLFYLANMPSVCFTALFSAGRAILTALRPLSLKMAGQFTLWAALSLLCLWPMALAEQRAGVGAYMVYVLILLFLTFWRAPKRCFVLLLGCLIVFIFLKEHVFALLDILSHKTKLVGGNMRLEELMAVWNVIHTHTITLFLGKGWGAAFSSPAVAGISVHYTHGLFSSLLLKTGLVGLGLGLLYLGALGFQLLKITRTLPMIALALALGMPVLIDVFLYASFKSLDFGLILLMIPAASSTFLQNKNT